MINQDPNTGKDYDKPKPTRVRESHSTVLYDSYLLDVFFLTDQKYLTQGQINKLLEHSLRNRKLLTTREAAQTYRLSPDRFEKWRSKGDGPPYIKLAGNPVEF